MRVLIDGQCLQTDSRERGIGRYTEGLIVGLCNNDVEVFVLLNGSYEPRCSEAIEWLSRNASQAKIELFYSVGDLSSCNIRGFDYFLSSFLYEDAVRRINPDIYLSSSPLDVAQLQIIPPLARISKVIPSATILYDLIPLSNVTKYLPTVEYRNTYFSELSNVFASSLILCISKYTENTLRELNPDIRTRVVYGSSFSDYVSLKRTPKRADYIFYCGGLDERKNVRFLVNAFSKLPFSIKKKHPLWICCRKSTAQGKELSKHIQHLNESCHIKLVETEDNNELALLYAQCYLFVFPSKLEGLGLPLIEALSYGAPILTSNASSLPEIVDNSDAWFDPENEESLISKLQQAAIDKVFYSKLCLFSQENKLKFSWNTVAKNCILGFEELSKKSSFKKVVEGLPMQFSWTFPNKLYDEFQISRIRQDRITIYFDISNYSITTAKTGIQRVVRKFMEYLTSELSAYNFDIVYVTGRSPDGYRAMAYEGNVWRVLGKISPTRGDWYVSVDLCACEILAHKEELLSWKKHGVRLFYYVYDLSFIYFPQFIADSNAVVVLTQWLNFVENSADCIMSETKTGINVIKNHAQKNKIDISRTQFIYQHLGSDFKCRKKATRSNNHVFQFLAVSTIEPRKGYASLLKAFLAVLKKGVRAKLVIVGRPGWKADDVINLLKTNPYAGRAIFWESDCSDQKLSKLYKESDCLVMASYDEGFGLGIVEGVRAGLPLLLRDIPVFREIAGNNALYFNELTLESRLLDVVRNPAILPSTAKVQTYTWKQSVHNTALQWISLASTNFYSPVKDVTKKLATPSILQFCEENSSSSDNVPQHASTENIVFGIKTYSKFSKFKFLILSKIHPSVAHRKHYVDKLNAVPLPIGYKRPLSKFRRWKYTYLSKFALTEHARNHYRQKLL